jgi:hypothetical protein
MPRPGPRRELVALRLSEEDIDWLDTLATERSESNRSEALRLCLAYAREKTALVVHSVALFTHPERTNARI